MDCTVENCGFELNEKQRKCPNGPDREFYLSDYHHARCGYTGATAFVNAMRGLAVVGEGF